MLFHLFTEYIVHTVIMLLCMVFDLFLYLFSVIFQCLLCYMQAYYVSHSHSNSHFTYTCNKHVITCQSYGWFKSIFLLFCSAWTEHGHVVLSLNLCKVPPQLFCHHNLDICTPCLKKNDNDVAHYNFNTHYPILVIFCRYVAEWVRY